MNRNDIVNRGVATCTHERTCVPEKMSKRGKNGFICIVAHTHSKKKTYKEVFQNLLGRMIEHYLFACKQLSNLLSLHGYTFYLVSEAD